MWYLRVAVKQFLTREFQWERPPLGISQGRWRTLQLVVEKKVEEKLKSDGHALKKKIEKTGCKIYREPLRDDKKRLVSISGPREKLDEAEKILLTG